MKTYNAVEETWSLCTRTMEGPGHSGRVSSVAFSPDGKCIVSGSRDNTLRLWDTVSGAHLNTLRGHSSYVHSVAFSSDGTRIMSGSWDTLRLWDAVSGVHLNTLGQSGAASAAFSWDGNLIVCGCDDKTLRLCKTFKGHSEWVGCVAFSPDGRRIVSGSNDTLRVWDTVTGDHINT
jgi:WD40 repeat protein